MKKMLLAIVLACAACCGVLAADEPMYDMRIVINGVTGDSMGRLPVEEFRRMVSAEKRDKRMTLAEDTGRVTILITDSPYLLDEKTNTYRCRFAIEWKDENNTAFKTINLVSQITLGNKTTVEESKSDRIWRIADETYTKVAKWSLPVVILIAILAAL